MLDAWVKTVAKDVSVRRVPVAFRDNFVPQQRMFYALEAMGVLEKLHAKIFTAIHGALVGSDRHLLRTYASSVKPIFYQAYRRLYRRLSGHDAASV